MIIKDLIGGQILTLSDRTDAIREAKSRVKYYNKTFNYSHRGVHYSENAIMTVNDDMIIIERSK
jgi:hypothetical protein